MGERLTQDQIETIAARNRRWFASAGSMSNDEMWNACAIRDLLATVEALRTALARVEGERDDWMQRAAKGAESFNAALADCRVLAAECEAIRFDFAACGATASEHWRAAMTATDASGALARHAEGGGK